MARGGEKKVRKQKAEPQEADAVEDQSAIASATLRDVRMSPRKARIILNMVKDKQVEPALQMLQFAPQKGAVILSKLLRSAIMNAKEHKGADVDSLWVTGGWVNEGRTMKRFMPRARGSAYPIRKRSAHITVVLGEK